MAQVLLNDAFLTFPTNYNFSVETIVQSCQLVKNLSVQSRVLEIG